MKLILALLIASSASAFAPTRFGITRSRCSTAVYNSRVDSSDAIQAALEASKKFGPASKEARVAWDIVEEMDSSDNSNAYTGGVSDEDSVYNANDPAVKEYDRKIASLAKLLEEQQAQVVKMKTLAEEIQAVKLASPKVAMPGPDSAEMRQALDDAKKATDEFGSDSAEARIAWETVEEVASSDNSVATEGALGDECLVETIEACEAIEELNRVISLNQNKDQGRYSG